MDVYAGGASGAELGPASQVVRAEIGMDAQNSDGFNGERHGYLLSLLRWLWSVSRGGIQ